MSSLFEIQRIWDAWPNIKNAQVLRDLFSQSSFHAGSIENVFIIPGHVFVATSHHHTSYSLDRACLYAFSCAPTKRGSWSHDSHVTSCLLPLTDECTRVVAVLDNSTPDRQQIWVVHDSGELSVFLFNSEEYSWKFRECTPLTPYEALHDCASLSSGHLLYSEQLTPSSSSRGNNYQLSHRRFENGPDGSLVLSAPTVLLTNAPPMDLLPFEGGVSLLPAAGPSPHGLLMVWKQGQKTALPYVWNSPVMPPRSPPTTNFTTITVRLAGVWSQASQDPPLVSMATHPVTNQLLALAGDGSVYEITESYGVVRRRRLVRLSNFSRRYPTAQSVFAHLPLTSRVQLFALHTCYGIALQGEVRLYDSFTGECVWESDSHEGAETRLWTTPTTSCCCGLYNNSGVWVIRSKRITDHAHFVAHTPLTRNTDEITPDNRLDNGGVLAARLCQLWGMDLLATKYALETACSSLKELRGESDMRRPFLPELDQELIAVLKEGSLQNPALMVALTAEHPHYRHTVTEQTKQFLESYRGSRGETASDLLTPLNSEIVPLLEQYLQLSEQYESILSLQLPGGPSGYLPGARQMVLSVLSQLERSSVHTEDSTASLRAQLHSLTLSHPHQALAGIKDFFGVSSFKDAVKQLEEGVWEGERNWRSLFTTESVPKLQSSLIQSSGPHLPLFEMTCRLLYLTHPQELLDFVMFAQLARDFHAGGDSAFARRCRKNFFFSRALDALPAFIPPQATPTSSQTTPTSSQATPTSSQAIQARCQLLLQSDHPSAAMASLQLLLLGRLWPEAVALVEQTRQEAPPTPGLHGSLFHTLLTHMARGGVLMEYLDRVWEMRPPTFSVFDFLSLLRGGRGEEQDQRPVLVGTGGGSIPLSAVLPKVLELLQSN